MSNILKCRTCGHRVSFQFSGREGWPKCCGKLMERPCPAGQHVWKQAIEDIPEGEPCECGEAKWIKDSDDYQATLADA